MKGWKQFKILIFLLLYSRWIRSLFITLSGSFVIGTILNDVLFVSVYIIGILFSLERGDIRLSKRPESVLLVTMLFIGVFQALSFYLGFTYRDFMMASSNLRRYFIALPMFFVITFLIRHSGLSVSSFFERLVRLFETILKMAVCFQIIEYLLREYIPAFNQFFTKVFIAPLVNSENVETSFANISDLYKSYLGSHVTLLRAFGIGLDFHLSGAIILFSYTMFATFSKRFKQISIFNLLVGFCLLLTGSTSFVIPFIIINAVLLFIRLRKSYLKYVIILAGLAGVGIVLLPAFGSENGYLTFLKLVLPGFISNIPTFISGIGPIRMNIYGAQDIGISAENGAELFIWVKDFGILTFFLEAGLVIFLMLLIFLGVVIKSRISSSGIAKPKVILMKIILLFSFVIYTLHYAVFFNPIIITFLMTLICLIYLSSETRKMSVGLRAFANEK